MLKEQVRKVLKSYAFEFVFCSDFSHCVDKKNGDKKRDETSGKCVIHGVYSNRCKKFDYGSSRDGVFGRYVDVSII
jgi:cation transport regulator ChaB